MKTSLVGFSYVILKSSRTSESELQFGVDLLLSFISLEQSKKSFEKIGQQEARSWCSLSIITNQEKEDSVISFMGKKLCLDSDVFLKVIPVDFAPAHIRDQGAS